jgi:hypothetical protein
VGVQSEEGKGRKRRKGRERGEGGDEIGSLSFLHSTHLAIFWVNQITRNS